VRDIVAELFDLFGVQPRTRAALVATANRYNLVDERPVISSARVVLAARPSGRGGGDVMLWD
jgi:hypothetical protein